MDKILLRLCPMLLVVLLLSVRFSTPARASAPILTLLPSTAAAVNTPLDLPLRVSGVSDLAAFEFDLQYDTAFIQSVTSLTPSNAMGSISACSPATQRCVVTLPLLTTANSAAIGVYTYGTGVGNSADTTVATLRLQPAGLEGDTLLHMQHVIIVNTQGAKTALPDQQITLHFGESSGVRVYIPFVSN